MINKTKGLISNTLRTFCLCAICGTTPSVWTPLRAQETGFANQNYIVDEAVKTLAGDAALARGQAGIHVLDVQTGQTLGGHNANMSLIPASNMKIVSTAPALKLLGADFTFRTDLQYEGSLTDSVLIGNIIIKGYGDPTLGSPQMPGAVSLRAILDTFSQKIKALGVKKIVGKIVGDGTAFEPTTAVPTWLWEDLGNYYGVGPSGLNIHENAFTLNFHQHPTVGMPPSISGLSPFVPHFILKNNVLSSAGGGDDAYIFMSPYAQEGVVRGTISAGNGIFGIKGALPDPPLFAAWHLQRMLNEQGIEVTDTATTQLMLEQKGEPTALRRTFYTWRSQPLADIVRHANLESVNLYCETFLRTLALQQLGFGTNDKGIEIITKFWQGRGVNTEGFFMQDGSGLSPRNGITPTQLTTMLRAIAQDSAWFAPFFNSLPEAGRSGTLSSMFKQHPSVMGRLRAKSGTITRVRAYSGYVTANDGRLIAFSILLNNFTCSQRDIRKKLETFMAELCRL